MASVYEAARVEARLIDDLLKLASAKQEVGTETDIQKGKIIEEYGADLRATTKKIEDAMRKAAKKKRKKKWWEKAVPLLASFIPAIGPIAAGSLTGIVSGTSLKKDAKFAESTAKNLQKYIKSTPLKSKWAKSFVGQKALDFKAGRLDRAADLDEVIEAAQKAGSAGNIFKTALTAGVTSYLSKMEAQGDLGNIGQGKGGGFFNQPQFMPGASTMYTGPTGGSVAVNLAGTGPAVFPGLASGMRSFAPFQGKNFSDLLTGIMNKDEASLAYTTNILGALRNLQD